MRSFRDVLYEGDVVFFRMWGKNLRCTQNRALSIANSFSGPKKRVHLYSYSTSRRIFITIFLIMMYLMNLNVIG
jgi:hypothetical protein